MRRDAFRKVTSANRRRVNGPATHPSCATLQDRDRTPDPITAVIICATAVHTFPSSITKWTSKKPSI